MLQRARKVDPTPGLFSVVWDNHRIVRVREQRVQVHSPLSSTSVYANTVESFDAEVCIAVEQSGVTFGFVVEQPLGLVAVHLAPVEGAGRDLLQVGHEAVDVVHLRVHLGGGRRRRRSQQQRAQLAAAHHLPQAPLSHSRSGLAQTYRLVLTFFKKLFCNN